jgi:predicted ATPase/DNA-binding CsgD family transcriptional regulator
LFPAAIYRRLHRQETSLVDPPGFSGIPRPRTVFVGREDDLAAVTSLLEDAETRIATLTGPGGVGKTRLAIAAADKVAVGFPGNVIFVDLTTATSPDHVADFVAAAAQARTSGKRPSIDFLARALGDKRTLLILDNFEHVLDATPLISHLIDRCPGLKVLATSRERLRIAGERLYLVQPLPIASQVDSPAIQLFLERAGARAGSPVSSLDVDLVAEVCRRLDGLPLAIELAAARAQFLRILALLGDLTDRLPLLTGGPQDAPERQRTMVHTITWSYASLSPTEQHLFAALSVFAGGWTLEAAGQVAGSAGIPDDALLQHVISLADKSLVQQAEPGYQIVRFHMLETIREFAASIRRALPDNEVMESSHAAYFLQLATTRSREVFAAGGRSVQTDMERDWANFRAAFARFEEERNALGAAQMARALGPFCWRSRRIAVLHELVTRALAIPGSTPSRTRALALAMRSHCEWARGNLDQARADADEVLQFSQKDQFDEGIALALWPIVLVESSRGNLAEALEAGLQAIALSRRTGPDFVLAGALHDTGLVYQFLGDHETGVALMHESLHLVRSLGRNLQAGMNLPDSGLVALRLGDLSEASARFKESAEVLLAEADPWYIGNALAGLAIIAEMTGRAGDAATLFGRTATCRELSGTQSLQTQKAMEEQAAVAAARSIGQAAYDQRFDAGRHLTLAEAVRLGVDVATAVAADAPAHPGDHGAPAVQLTARERDVLELLAEGLSDRAIADALFIERSSVRTHVTNLFAKLGVNSRTAAVSRAAQLGIVARPPASR